MTVDLGELSDPRDMQGQDIFNDAELNGKSFSNLTDWLTEFAEQPFQPMKRAMLEALLFPRYFLSPGGLINKKWSSDTVVDYVLQALYTPDVSNQTKEHGLFMVLHKVIPVQYQYRFSLSKKVKTETYFRLLEMIGSLKLSGRGNGLQFLFEKVLNGDTRFLPGENTPFQNELIVGSAVRYGFARLLYYPRWYGTPMTIQALLRLCGQSEDPFSSDKTQKYARELAIHLVKAGYLEVAVARFREDHPNAP